MTQNMGTVDRIVRFVVAILFAALYFLGYISGWFGILLLVVGGVLLLTSILGFCPLYVPFKFSTKGS